MSISLRRALLLALLIHCVAWFVPAANAPAAPLSAPVTAPHDAFVFISGGGTELSNNYSQYLQARAIAGHFKADHPQSSWVFFGAGNIEGQPAVFGDVRRQKKQEDMVIDTWVAGALPGNHPAKRAAILKTLREEVLPTVREGGTLYLFVGDHGSLSDDDKQESIFNLWTLEPSKDARHGWRANGNEAIGVSELRQVLAEGLGRGRAVFVMTQCHSGGFHYLAVPRKMTADPAWLVKPLAAAAAESPASFPLVAGFTATDEQSLAAGCDPSPDPDSWSGYERYVPEKLLGLDLFTLKSNASPLPSFAAAHEAAILIDPTIDKPMSTSEEYLAGWADLIDTELSDPKKLTSAVQKRVVAYNQAVNTGKIDAQGAPALRERQELFARFIQRMTEQNPDAKNLLMSGTRGELEEAAGLKSGSDHQQHHHHRSADDDMAKLWNGTVRPAWQAAVLAGEIDTIPKGAMPFEKHLLDLEEQGHSFVLERDEDMLAIEVFWESGYNHPDTVAADTAVANALWAAERIYAIQGWAEQAEDPAVRKAAVKLEKLVPPMLSDEDMAQEKVLSRKTAAERALFYRRVLAAWAFLIASDEQPALHRLQEIIALERTPLPDADIPTASNAGRRR